MDQPAEELVKRHKLSSPLAATSSTPPTSRKPLAFRRSTATMSTSLGASSSATGTVSIASGGLFNGSRSNCAHDDGTSSLGSTPPINFTSPKMGFSAGREFVDSLHQNSRSILLYGKNNVMVQRDQLEPLAGYLSLHQMNNSLILKWTPNQLMSKSSSEESLEKR